MDRKALVLFAIAASTVVLICTGLQSLVNNLS